MYLLAIGPYELDTATVALIAAILALIGVVLNATWLEARRRRIEIETEKKALREALYSEIGWTLTQIIPLMHGWEWDEFKKLLSNFMSFDVYDTARKSPALFYQLHDAREIDIVYRLLRNLTDRVEEETKESGKDEFDKVIKRRLKELVAFLDVDMLKNATIRKRNVEKYMEMDKSEQLFEELAQGPWLVYVGDKLEK